MYKQVLAILSANEPSWEGIQAWSAASGQLTSLFTQLDDMAAQYATSLSGITQLKEEKREETAAKAMTIAGALRALAEEQHDMVLAAQLDFPNHELSKGSSIATGHRIDLVLSLAATHAAVLAANYEILQTDIDALATLNTALREAEGTPRSAIIARKEVRAEMTALFHETDALLKKKLDQLILTRKISQPSFYQQYKDARKIVDYKGPKQKKGEVPEG